MNIRHYGATTLRILRQLKGDHRTLAMIGLVPAILIVLLYFICFDLPPGPDGRTLFDRLTISLLGLLPFIAMFLITSITMQRERSSGTLERLLTTPLSKLDLLMGYGTAFSLAAAVQAAIACGVSFMLLDLVIMGNPWFVLIIAVVDAILGVALGLLCSAFARTEFQAVQFMPVVVVPQLLLCGLLVPRHHMPTLLEWISNALPLSYAVDGLTLLATKSHASVTLWRDVGIVAGIALVALFLAASTLRRRTP